MCAKKYEYSLIAVLIKLGFLCTRVLSEGQEEGNVQQSDIISHENGRQNITIEEECCSKSKVQCSKQCKQECGNILFSSLLLLTIKLFPKLCIRVIYAN